MEFEGKMVAVPPHIPSVPGSILHKDILCSFLHVLPLKFSRLLPPSRNIAVGAINVVIMYIYT